MQATRVVRYGKTTPTKNLGWLLKNRNKYGGVWWVTINHAGRDEGELEVYFNDRQVIFFAHFSSFEILYRFTDRHLVNWMCSANIKYNQI